MNPTSLFTVALGLQAPWGVADVAFDRPAGRIDFQVAFTPGARFACPHCGAEHQPVPDTQEREWRHLNFFQFEAYIHAKVPRVRCEACAKTTQIAVCRRRRESGAEQPTEKWAAGEPLGLEWAWRKGPAAPVARGDWRRSRVRGTGANQVSMWSGMR